MLSRIVVVAGLSMAAGATAGYLFTREQPTGYIVLDTDDTSRPAAKPAPLGESLETILARESVLSERAAVYQAAARADETALAAMLEDADALADSELKDLLLGALARWAETAPERAYQEALSIDDRQLRSSAIERVAAVWVERDRAGALTEADLLRDDPIGRAFRSAIVSRMGRIDPAAMVAYVNGSPQHQDRLIRAVIGELEIMAPLEALGWAEQLTGRVGESARRSALQSWAREDPLAAYAYAESMPIGDERAQLLHSVARAYGRRDPDGALFWAKSLAHGPADLSASVIAGIADVDPERALDLAFTEASAPSNGFGFARGRLQMLNSVIFNALGSPSIAMPDILERVLALPDRTERSNALRMLTDRWARTDPRGAFDWFTTQGSLPTDGASELIISTLTRLDPLMAASYTDRVAPAMRDRRLDRQRRAELRALRSASIRRLARAIP